MKTKIRCKCGAEYEKRGDLAIHFLLMVPNPLMESSLVHITREMVEKRQEEIDRMREEHYEVKE